MAAQVVAENNDPNQSALFNNMISAAQTYQMNYLAFFGANEVVNASPADSANEIALREILKETRNQLPGIELGVVIGNANNFSDFETSDIQFAPSSTRICEPPEGTSLSSQQLMDLMNPSNPTNSEIYRAEVLKFVARLFKYFNGSYTTGQTQLNSTNNNHTGSKDDDIQRQAAPYEPPERGDYFDWVSLDHEYWVGSKAAQYGTNSQVLENSDVDQAYNDHKLILDAIQSLLSTSLLGCYAQVESYESIIRTSYPIIDGAHTSYISTPLNMQAHDLSARVDRILANHYFQWPETIDDRYCHAIEAWGHHAASATAIWPAFSVERSDEAKTYCPSGDSTYWNDFLGWFMDPSLPCVTGHPCTSLDPNAPYDVDEIEDVYLNEIKTSNWSCKAEVGSYQPAGFMWFILHLMDEQGVVKKRGSVSNNTNPLRVYPNPVSQKLNLPVNSDLVNVFSATGHRMPIHMNGSQLSVEDYPEGLYILHFKEKNRFVKIKVQHQ